MKKLITIVLAVAVLSLIGIAHAGSVYDRTTVTIPAAGSATWTNQKDYSALKLVRIWQVAATASNDIAVTRISADSVYTQTVGTVTGAATVPNSTATFTAAYLGVGDKLSFVSTPGTGGVVMLEYEVQQH